MAFITVTSNERYEIWNSVDRTVSHNLLRQTTKKTSWPWFNIKISSYQYRKSHCWDKKVIRSSYLHNGISYTSKRASLYWFSPLAEPQITGPCDVDSLHKGPVICRMFPCHDVFVEITSSSHELVLQMCYIFLCEIDVVSIWPLCGWFPVKLSQRARQGIW